MFQRFSCEPQDVTSALSVIATLGAAMCHAQCSFSSNATLRPSWCDRSNAPGDLSSFQTVVSSVGRGLEELAIGVAEVDGAHTPEGAIPVQGTEFDRDACFGNRAHHFRQRTVCDEAKIRAAGPGYPGKRWTGPQTPRAGSSSAGRRTKPCGRRAEFRSEDRNREHRSRESPRDCAP